MKKYKLLIERRAENEILGIRKYIIEKFGDPMAANKIVQDFLAEFERLKSLPEGTPVKFVWKGYEVRYVHCRNYTIVYSSNKGEGVVRVHAVMYSRRNIERVLREG